MTGHQAQPSSESGAASGQEWVCRIGNATTGDCASRRLQPPSPCGQKAFDLPDQFGAVEGFCQARQCTKPLR